MYGQIRLVLVYNPALKDIKLQTKLD